LKYDKTQSVFQIKIIYPPEREYCLASWAIEVRKPTIACATVCNKLEMLEEEGYELL